MFITDALFAVHFRLVHCTFKTEIDIVLLFILHCFNAMSNSSKSIKESQQAQLQYYIRITRNSEHNHSVAVDLAVNNDPQKTCPLP